MAGKNIYIEKILDNLLSGVDTALNAVKEAMQKMIGGDDPETQKSLPDVVNQLVANQQATAEMLDNVQDRLDTQIAELQSVVNVIGQTINPANIIVTANGTLTKNLIFENDKYIYDIPAGTSSADAATLMGTQSTLITKQLKSLVNGQIKILFNNDFTTPFNFDVNCNRTTAAADPYLYRIGFKLIVNDGDNDSVLYDSTEKTVTFHNNKSGQFLTPTPINLNILKDKTYSFRFGLYFTGNSTGYYNAQDVDLHFEIPKDFITIAYDFKDIIAPGGIFEEVE